MGGKRFTTKAMRAHVVHISLLPLATLVAPILGQLQFNGGVSSSSNNNGNSANRNTNRPTSGDVDEKFFLGGDTPSLTGNQALDGGIVGLGLGALGAAVLGPTIQGALNGANKVKASTPVEGGRGKPTLEEAPPLEELELEGNTLTERSGSSCPPARGAPATMAGGGGKHLERMSLEQGSLAVSLVAPLTVAAAVTTASLSTTTVSTATSRTREDSTTREVSTARALTRTRASTTRTTESANATTV